MILFDSAIKEAMIEGSINIDPFIPEHLGVNSYDVRLGETLLVYQRTTMSDDWHLDMRQQNPTGKFTIPPEGFILKPGILYIGHTMERVGTSSKYVPHIEGRSSVGRLGMAIHITAGFGDCGFDGIWTLEITVVHPLKVYAGERIAQAYFMEGKGEPEKLYRGKYRGFDQPVSSLMFLDQET